MRIANPAEHNERQTKHSGENGPLDANTNQLHQVT